MAVDVEGAIHNLLVIKKRLPLLCKVLVELEKVARGDERPPKPTV